MRIAIIHNRYGTESPSGEDLAVDAEASQLEDEGLEVVRIEEQGGGVGIRRAALAGMTATWNPRSARRIRIRLEECRPDIVHIHNLFPFLSPSVVWAARRAGCPVVMTLHNYRLICANGLLLRDGKVCQICVDQRHTIAAVVNRCYKQSRTASAAIAVSIETHRRMKTWTRAVDGLIVFSDFQSAVLRRAGIEEVPIHVKPNTMPTEVHPIPWSHRQPRVAFIGRLSHEKGVDVVIDAWRLLGEKAPPLCIVGSGPLEHRMRSQLSGLQTPVHFTGLVDASRAQGILADSKLVILPSLCYEGYPLVVREAFAYGVPVIASDHGPMSELLDNLGSEFRIPPGAADVLATRIRELWEKQDHLEETGSRMRAEYETRLRPRFNVDRLLDIYRETILQRERVGRVLR